MFYSYTDPYGEHGTVNFECLAVCGHLDHNQ
jgi:hypothetical protein